MANKPNNPSLWSRAKSMARQKFDVYPSAYANGWAAKYYKSKGGTWRKGQLGMNKTTVPFPQSVGEYMRLVGANPKYRDLDSSSILPFYSKDKSSWPKSLDITEETCSEPGKCGKTSKYKVSATPAAYNWSSSKPAVKPAVKPTMTAVSKPASSPTFFPTTSTTKNNLSKETPSAVSPAISPSPTVPGSAAMLQRFQYMTPAQRQKAVAKYGNPNTWPMQGVDVRGFEVGGKVSKFDVGGTSCPPGKTWSGEFNRCVNSYEDNYLKGLKKEREEIVGLYKTGADKSVLDSRTKAFKEKYKKESGESVQLFCDKFDCKIPVETSSSTTTTVDKPYTPSFNIKRIISDQYVPDVKNQSSRDWRYRIETDKGFDILPSKKAFDDWKEKYKSAYQPYYEKSNRITSGSQNTVDYNKGRIQEYLETPTLKYDETPKLVEKRGGEIKSKMKDGGKMFAQFGMNKPIYTSNPYDPRIRRFNDSLTAFNNVNIYNQKIKDLKNQEIKKGASTRYDPLYTTGLLSDHGFSSYDAARNAIDKATIEERSIYNKYLDNLRYYPTHVKTEQLYYHHPSYIDWRTLTRHNASRHENFPYYTFPKPKQPIIYKPGTVNTMSTKPSVGTRNKPKLLGLFRNKPKPATSTTISRTPRTSSSTSSFRTTTSTTPSTSTTVETAPKTSSVITSVPTTSPVTTSRESTPRVSPTPAVKGSAPIYQRWGQMTDPEIRRKAIKKYGDPSKFPLQGVDIRTLEKGGKVSVKAGGENHVVYKKETKQGEGKVGNIMVNHPTMDKGKWDTIDLTAMNKKINTVKKGVAATKKWHKENPYPKKKMQTGDLYNNPFGNTSNSYLRPTVPSVFAPKEAEAEETTPSYVPQTRREKRTAYENLVRSSAYPVMKTRPSGEEYESRDATMRKLLTASKEESGMNFRQRRRLGQDVFGEPRRESMADYRKWYPASSFNASGQNANRSLRNKFGRIGELIRIAGSKGPGRCAGGDCNKMKMGGLTPAQKAAGKLAKNMKGKVVGSDRMLKHGGVHSKLKQAYFNKYK